MIKCLLFAALLCAIGMWVAPSWALTCGSPTIANSSNGFTHDGTTDDTANFNSVLSTCAAPDIQLDCSSNTAYAINGTVGTGRFTLTGCGKGNTPLKFGASGTWEVYGSTSTVKNLYVTGNSSATAFVVNSTSCYNLFLNNYFDSVSTFLQDNGCYNSIDHLTGIGFSGYAVTAYGTSPVWHDIQLNGGSHTVACIYSEAQGIIMNSFLISGCQGAMVINGHGNACQTGTGNWSKISDGFFDIGWQSVDNATSAAMLIENNSGGTCKMGSTHFTNVSFESNEWGLYIDGDGYYNSTINSVTCSGCQMHNNSHEGLYIGAASGNGMFRFNDTTILADGGQTDGTTTNSPDVTINCSQCLVFFTGASIGGEGFTPGSEPFGETVEGPNEPQKATYAISTDGGVGTTTKILMSNTYIDTYKSTNGIYDPRNVICFNPLGYGPNGHNLKGYKYDNTAKSCD